MLWCRRCQLGADLVNPVKVLYWGVASAVEDMSSLEGSVVYG